MSLGCGEWGVVFRAGESREDYESPLSCDDFITGVWKCFSINRNDVYVV